MKIFNYRYYGQIISRAIFIANVPKDWMDNLDEWGEYSYGGYRASCIN